MSLITRLFLSKGEGSNSNTHVILRIIYQLGLSNYCKGMLNLILLISFTGNFLGHTWIECWTKSLVFGGLAMLVIFTCYFINKMNSFIMTKKKIKEKRTNSKNTDVVPELKFILNLINSSPVKSHHTSIIKTTLVLQLNPFIILHNGTL